MAAMLSLALVSCGTLNRTKQVTKTTKASSVDSSTLKASKSDSAASSRTTIREKVDTSVAIKGGQQSGSKPASNILAGDSLVLDSDIQRVVVDHDPATGNLRARATVKDRQAHILIDKETTQDHSVQVKREQAESTHVARAEAQTSEAKQVHTEAEAGPGLKMWVALWISLGLMLALILVFYRRKFGWITRLFGSFTGGGPAPH